MLNEGQYDEGVYRTMGWIDESAPPPLHVPTLGTRLWM